MNVRVTILVDGEARVGYDWPVVPRVGEHIKLNATMPNPQLVEVVDIVYANGADGGCRVDVICEVPVQ